MTIRKRPTRELAVFKYDDCELQFEVRGLLTGGEGAIDYADGNNGYVGNMFYGSDGWMSVDLKGFQIYLGEDRKVAKEMKHVEPEEWATTPHVQNFLKAVRSRNPKDLTCDIEEGYFSAALCHMANISYRTGRKLHFDPKTERFVNDEEANSYITRKYREPFVVPENV